MGRQFSHDSILVIDDFPHMRASLKRMLYELGEENVELAADGDEALKLLGRKRFDIILCDFNLGPGKDGQQVLEEGRELGVIDPTAVFIMITAEASRPYVLGTLEHAPDDYITKPFTKELLLFRTRKAYERRDVLRDIYGFVADGDVEAACALGEERARQGDKYSLDILRLLSELYLDSGRTEQALATLEAVAGNRDLPWANFAIARAEFQLGNPEAAITGLRDLLFHNDYFLEAYDLLAQCYVAVGEPGQAQVALQDAVQVSSRSLRRQRDLAGLALQNDDLDSAEKAYRMAIRLGDHSSSRSAREYIGLADVLTRQKKTHKALLLLKNGLKTFAGSVDDRLRLLGGIARHYLSQSQAGDAAAALQEAGALYRRRAQSVMPETSIELARTIIESGDSERGEEILATVARNNHDDASYLEKIRQVLAELGSDQTVEDLLDSTVREMAALNRKGIELTERGQLAEAISLFEQASENAPSNRSFNLNAAQAMIMHMQSAGARPALLYKARMHLDRVSTAGKSDERHAELNRMYQALVT